jgi:hypothetical protein
VRFVEILKIVLTLRRRGEGLRIHLDEIDFFFFHLLAFQVQFVLFFVERQKEKKDVGAYL